MKKRSAELDFIKGLAIILVVVGHTISGVISPDPDVFEENPAFRFCYSFHMALFAFASGWAARLSMKPELRVLGKRLRRLLVPYAFGLILFYAILRRESPSTFLSPTPYWYLPFAMIADCVFFAEERFRLRGGGFAAAVVGAAAVCFLTGKDIDLARHIARFLPFYWLGTVFPAIKARAGDKLPAICCVSAALFLAATPLYGQGDERQLRRLDDKLGLSDPGRPLRIMLALANKYAVPLCGIGLALLLAFLAYRYKRLSAAAKPIEELGRRTLFIYLFHDLFFVKPTSSPAMNCVISAILGLAVPAAASDLYGALKRRFLADKSAK